MPIQSIPNDIQNLEARIVRYSELCSISTIDSGDPLIEMQITSNSLPIIDLSYTPYPFVRQQTWNRLIEAAKTLQAIDQNYALRIWYAYRPLSIQIKQFNEQHTKLQKKFPLLSQFELMEKVHEFVAVPDVAGHPTGAALDLTITQNGKELDMGCGYLDFDSNQLPVFCEGLTDDQMNNRMLLRKIMMDNDFAPFNGEWWHFSYGDKEWAAFWDKPHALFDVVEQIAIYDCNPGGNYTYIAYGIGIERENYRYLDQKIRSTYPYFEQGGFIEPAINKDCVLRIHMAGGEFCANAIRCVAALIAQDYTGKRKLASIANSSLILESAQGMRFAIEISGVKEILMVGCSIHEDGYIVKAEMPLLKEFSNIVEKQITLQSQLVKVVVVKMQGITHILVDEASFPFVQFPDEQYLLVDSAIDQCQLQAEAAVGLIWYSFAKSIFAIHPIVWVRDIKTCIYESACGSGSLALALQQLKKSFNKQEIYDVKQPSGAIIKVLVSKSTEEAQFTQAAIEGLVSLKPLPDMQIAQLQQDN